MKNADLLIAVNTVWVVLAAVLVMFMQAGFAFLESGLTRMKNAAHIAGKNVLIFGVCSIVYWAVGFGIAFGDGNSRHRDERLLPVDRRVPVDRRGAVHLLLDDPGWGRLPVRGRLRRRLARDRLGRDGRAGEALGLLRLRRVLHGSLLGRLALGLALGRLALLEGHAGLRRLDRGALPGRARSARRRAAPRPADRQVRPRRAREPDPRPQHAVRRPRDADPLVRLVRLQRGLDARRRDGRQDRLLRLRGADDDHRSRRRRHGRDRRRVARPAEAGRLDDAERRDRGAGGDHRSVGLRRAVGRGRDRRGRGRDRSGRSALGRADRDRRPDRRGRRARHGRRLGNAGRRASSRSLRWRRTSRRAPAASSTRAASTSSACRRSGWPRSASSRSQRRSAASGR